MRFTGIFREESNDSEEYYYVNNYIRFVNELSKYRFSFIVGGQDCYFCNIGRSPGDPFRSYIGRSDIRLHIDCTVVIADSKFFTGNVG